MWIDDFRQRLETEHGCPNLSEHFDVLIGDTRQAHETTTLRLGNLPFASSAVYPEGTQRMSSKYLRALARSLCKNDEGYFIEELAVPLPTHLSIIKTILVLQSEPVGSDEENIVRFKGLLSARKITNRFVFNIVAACCDFYSFGWMARPSQAQPPFRHYLEEKPRRAAGPAVRAWRYRQLS